MLFMFDVYYKSSPDPRREERIAELVSRRGGSLTYREAPPETGTQTICLTYEFDRLEAAQAVVASLLQQGEHVAGPADTGP